MPASTEPNSGLNYGWPLGESGWNTGMDANLLKIGRVLGQASVLDKDLTDPPASPANGDRYIVATGGINAWLGHDGEIAVWDGAAWVFYAPANGWRVNVLDEEITYVYRTNAWVRDRGALAAPSNVVVGASPFVHQNTGKHDIEAIIAGGTVTLIEFSRDGATWYDAGITAGMVWLSPGDRVRVTYSAAPTMTAIPR